MDSKTFVSKYAVDRHNTNSMKWDYLEEVFGQTDLLPLWVADMEFKAPEQVIEAMVERSQHGVFGYTFTPESYYQAFIDWQKTQHNIHLEKDWIRFSTGVVASIYNCITIFTNPGDAVMIATPVYHPFQHAIKDTKRTLVYTELLNDNGNYSFDFNDFEAKLTANNVRMFIHCSPHNPVGRVWTKDELATIFTLCRKHGVLLISDEIHQDIIIGNKPFVSALTLQQENHYPSVVVLSAPSKTFNLASLLNSHLIIAEPGLRERYDEGFKMLGESARSVLGQLATETAYQHGSDWLTGLLATIKANYDYICQTFASDAPNIIIAPLEGTYLAWIDLRAYVAPAEIKTFIQDQCHLAINYGEDFGEKYQGFIRMNLATTPEIVQEATQRIITAIEEK
ncbi:MalY/PatB family protein [Culicoidibacter larvae]|uniref:cysteine-S-conjugate beta-lyase n=1 Tax=Culicoidibacter larvae TaxID=2579976 RepID=A0A5R8QFQ1_9FIRM|nr:MalY/PatB family protein [Culicoidibacter larvae]TLG76802.1 pyridoxal phosphate-dependent aminotransferase [Culicoidibacter larvae]